MECKVESTTHLFQSPLTPLSGAATDPESSTPVEPASTMQFFWSELLVETGKSRTLGEQDGEKQDTSDLPLETLVEFAQMVESLSVFDHQSKSIKLSLFK